MQSSEPPAPDVFPQSTCLCKRQPSPQPSSVSDMAALLEQEPSPDSLQPLAKSEEPEAADTAALQPPVSQASISSGSDIGHSDGGFNGGNDDCNAADGDGYCSHSSIIGASYSAGGESDVVSSLNGGAGSSSVGASSGDGSNGGSHAGKGAADEDALAPDAPADLGDSSDAGSPAGGSEFVVKTPGGSSGDGSGGAPAETGHTTSLTANKLMTGEVSFLDFNSQLQEATARQGRVRGEDRGEEQGGGMQAADQDVSGVVHPSAKAEASCFLADLGCECALHPKFIWLSALQPVES